MNAWFWRCVVAGSLLSAVLWCSYWWSRCAVMALAGVLLLASAAGLQLGVQMLLMRRLLRRRAVALPPPAVAFRAWLGEWRCALQIFGWQIPFREHAQPDALSAAVLGASPQGRVGMVLVHGYFCNRGVWNRWLRGLRARGIPCAAMTLEPAHGGTMDEMVGDLDRSVKAMVRATGRAPLLVAHSMGGLVVRAWLKTLSARERAQCAAHVVTIATPHRGAWLGRFAQRLPARDMREHSAWLQQLGLPPEDVGFSCWCSSSDNIVYPPDLAVLSRARVHQVDDAAHIQLLCDARVWRHCLQLNAELQGGPNQTMGLAAGGGS
ncbi:esterase/lipase family protein [Comamonas guangdongensis]|uniref:Esterase/lipase family protein n=1 Tax=Comamonas guangdongensis TaxID=510515 RepID=A0ABV3ZTT0_9BURK